MRGLQQRLRNPRDVWAATAVAAALLAAEVALSFTIIRQVPCEWTCLGFWGHCQPQCVQTECVSPDSYPTIHHTASRQRRAGDEGLCGSPYGNSVRSGAIYLRCPGSPQRTDVPRADTEIDWMAYMEQTRLFAEVRVLLGQRIVPCRKNVDESCVLPGGTECLLRYDSESIPQQWEKAI